MGPARTGTGASSKRKMSQMAANPTKIRLSVVVPCYKVEKCLPKYLVSLVGQTLPMSSAACCSMVGIMRIGLNASRLIRRETLRLVEIIVPPVNIEPIRQGVRHVKTPGNQNNAYNPIALPCTLDRISEKAPMTLFVTNPQSTLPSLIAN